MIRNQEPLTSKKAPPKKLPKPLQPKKQPPPKKVPKKRKRAGSDDEQPHKKSHSGDIIEAHNLPSLRYKFYPVDEQWQHDKCDFLGLQFHCKNRVSPGGPDIPLTPSILEVQTDTGTEHTAACWTLVTFSSHNQVSSLRQ